MLLIILHIICIEGKKNDKANSLGMCIRQNSLIFHSKPRALEFKCILPHSVKCMENIPANDNVGLMNL